MSGGLAHAVPTTSSGAIPQERHRSVSAAWNVKIAGCAIERFVNARVLAPRQLRQQRPAGEPAEDRVAALEGLTNTGSAAIRSQPMPAHCGPMPA